MSDHPIKDIKYTTEPNWICCLCGWESVADTPNEIDTIYRAHRKDKGAAVFALSEGRYHRGAPFVIRARHQRPDDPTVGYLMDARPLT